jgi:hypothetical protein
MQGCPQVDAPGVLLQTPVAASQVSVVQTLLSLQFLAVPLHMPAAQASFSVQALLSLHTIPPPVMGVNLHAPVVVLQLSVVQGLLSLHTTVVPPQIPFVHLSLVVQRLLSLHTVPFATFTYVQ